VQFHVANTDEPAGVAVDVAVGVAVAVAVAVAVGVAVEVAVGVAVGGVPGVRVYWNPPSFCRLTTAPTASAGTVKLCPADSEASELCEPVGLPANTEALPAVTVSFHPATLSPAAYTSWVTV
jgi:hypothetical protein